MPRHARPYQTEAKHNIYAAWDARHTNVGLALPTGGGKTFTFSEVIAEESAASAAIAHRTELVSQIAMALASNGVRHRIVGSKEAARTIAALQLKEFDRSFVDPHARCGVCSIDTLVNLNPSDPWLDQVRLWVGDEGHHFLRENKWGRGVSRFRRAGHGLLVSATWFRADGQGLGRGVQLPDGKWTNDGIADHLVLGPDMRWMIDNGYLTDTDIYAPPNDLDFSDVNVTASGDLSPEKNRAAMKRSTRIVGDIVRSYMDIAFGKLAVTFAVDVEEATKYAAAFNDAGIPAAVVHAKTPPTLRVEILKRFERREYLQLINVDLFGEGFDLPAIEVVQMARKTESKPLFDQQYGRTLRLMVERSLLENWDQWTVEQRKHYIATSEKPRAIIIDHVKNCERHGTPDGVRVQTLERRDRRVKKVWEDAIPLITCPKCTRVYEAIKSACPYCKKVREPAGRATPEQVDGVLHLMDDAARQKLRGEIARIDGPPRFPSEVSLGVRQSIMNAHYERQHAQKELRAAMDLFCGWQTVYGHDVDECMRRFYYMFGVDVASAMALGRPEAIALQQRIEARLAVDGIVAAV